MEIEKVEQNLKEVKCYSKLQDKYKDYLEKCKQSKKIV